MWLASVGWAVSTAGVVAATGRTQMTLGTTDAVWCAADIAAAVSGPSIWPGSP